MGVTNAQIMTKVEGMAKDIGEIKDCVKEADERQRNDHDKITELETRMSIFGLAQAAFTAVAAAFAGWIGVQK